MPDLSSFFPLILGTHITLAIALFLPSLLLPFTLRNRLVNQGFQRGTQGFTDAMGDLGRQENDLRLGITAAGLGEQQGLYGMARDAAGYEMQRRTQQQNAMWGGIAGLGGAGLYAAAGPGAFAKKLWG